MTLIVNPFLRSFWEINKFFMKIENHTILLLYGAKKQKNAFLGCFWLLEGYTYLQKPIVNQVLWLSRGVNQLSTTSGLRDMDFGQFWDFQAQFWPNKWVLPTFRLDHQASPENRPSKIPKQLLLQSLQELDNHSSSSTGL